MAIEWLEKKVQTVPSNPVEATCPPGDVIRCQRCQLVQFRTISGCCRRCLKPLPPELAVVPRNGSAEEPAQVLPGPCPARALALGSLPKFHLERPKIGGVLQLFRNRRAMTQEQLARLAGIPRSYVSRIERDCLLPGPRITSRLAAALAVEIRDLLPGEPESACDTSLSKDPTCVQLFAEFSRLPLPDMAAVLREGRHMLAGNVVCIAQPGSAGSSAGETRALAEERMQTARLQLL